jgi:hypothetical protein
LVKQTKWYSHDSGIPHIKLFWLYVLIRRASMIPNFIIPSEYEMLDALKKQVLR